MGKKQKEKNTNSRVYRVAYALLAGLVGKLFRIHVTGRENEPDEGGFIVCANHMSATDPVVLCYAFKKHQVRFMAKKELFKVPVVSSIVRMLGAFPIDREGKDVGTIKNAVAMVEEGKCMGIFPQGHRYPEVDPRSTPKKNGAALIATKARATVIPAYIVRKNNKFKFFRKTWVIIGKPISFEELNYDPEGSGEYARITDLVFNEICLLGEGFDEKKAKAHNKEVKRAKKAEKKAAKKAAREQK